MAMSSSYTVLHVAKSKKEASQVTWGVTSKTDYLNDTKKNLDACGRINILIRP